MMRIAVLLPVLLIAFAMPTASAQAVAGAAADGRSLLTVAVREVPPFAMRDSAGNWQGLSVDLWQDVADKLDLEFAWRELSLEQTLNALQHGEVDVAVAALSVTSERERHMDFSHPYYVSGLAPAFAVRESSAWGKTLSAFFSWQLFSAVGSLVLVLMAAGFCIWLFERKHNAKQFGDGDVARGLGDGFWWSAVTMTTVGYGDKAPTTLGGRVVALVWMFVSLIIIASFTASIAASLTANRLEESALARRAIGELTVGVLAGSAGANYARNQGAVVRAFDALPAAITALENGRLDTIVHDAPVLRYAIRQTEASIRVSEQVLVRDDYAFAFPAGSPLRKRVNAALLTILLEPVWSDIKNRYLGTDSISGN